MPRKKLTLKEVKIKLLNINPDIQILSDEYIDNKTKLKCKCLIDGNEWSATWANLSRGKGCPKCGGTSKLTLDEIKKRLRKINPNVIILSDKYINAHQKLKCRCLTDGHEWETSWRSLSQGGGYSKYGDIIKLNLDEIKKRLRKINPNIKIMSNEYINCKTKLKCKCMADGCGYEWETIWSSLNSGKGCPKCGGGLKKTMNEIKNILKEINPNIEVLGETYRKTGTTKKRINRFIKCKCLIDGHEWCPTLSSLIQGCGCPICKLRNNSGKNNSSWKGGITSLNSYLRKHTLQWKYDSVKKYHHKCDVTNTYKNLTIHHTYNFSNIVKETLKLLNLPILEQTNQYTDFELKQMAIKCLELHYRYGLGICICENEHKLFHSIYGRENNTMEQYMKFKQMRLEQLNKDKTKTS